MLSLSLAENDIEYHFQLTSSITFTCCSKWNHLHDPTLMKVRNLSPQKNPTNRPRRPDS